MGTKASHFCHIVEQASRLSLNVESLELKNGNEICLAGAQAIARVNLPVPYHSTGTEREGFEPSLKSPLNSISSAAPSTARPSLQGVIQCGKSSPHHAISDYTLKV
jgi:hypothetical protein